MPEAILIAGANGAGKTTFARNQLPLAHAAAIFLNADEIQQTDPAFATPQAAARELLKRLDAIVAWRSDFALETTLSSMMYARRFPGWKAAGLTVSVYFLEVVTADLAVSRVARRVALRCTRPIKRWRIGGIISMWSRKDRTSCQPQSRRY